MKIRINFGEPNEKQKLFLMENHRHIAFGGARGGGKSWSVRCKAVSLCLRYPGITVMIIRRTYPELYANHIKQLKKLLKCGTKQQVAKYNDSKKELTFYNGSTIIFGYCDTDNDVERYQGTETDILFYDEATQLKEDWIKSITACVRGVNGYPKRVYYTCNPGGIGHAYIKRLFIDKQYLPEEHAEDYAFIQSLVYDNKVLMESDPDYLRFLEAQPEKRRRAWLNGEWDVFEGQVFEEFANYPEHYEERRWTHVINDFRIPDDWKIYRGLDWGFIKPFSVGWYAVDHKRRIYRIRELYGCTREANTGVKMTPQDVARRILEVEHSDPNLVGKKIIGIADPALWQVDTGESIEDMMNKVGVYNQKGDHSRITGKMQCHYRLAFDDMGLPMFYVFKSNTNFIRTIPTLIYDDHDVEDIDTTGEDHIYDEWRYVCMENPLNPKEIIKKKRPESDPLDLWEGEP